MTTLMMKKIEDEGMSDIKNGDVVKLKSGGPLMTVAISPMMDAELKDCIRAIWFDEKSGEYTFDDLPIFTLVKIDSQA